MIKVFIICIGLFLMLGISFLPVTKTIKSDWKENLEDIIREGMTAIALNIFIATLLILIRIGFN